MKKLVLTGLIALTLSACNTLPKAGEDSWNAGVPSAPKRADQPDDLN